MAQGKRHIPTEETRQTVLRAAGLGLRQELIAVLVGLTDNEALVKYYREELDIGKATFGFKVTSKLMEKIENGDLGAIIFYLKTQLGWKEAKDTDTNQDLITLLAQIMAKLPN
jgi:hypothetical protein